MGDPTLFGYRCSCALRIILHQLVRSRVLTLHENFSQVDAISPNHVQSVEGILYIKVVEAKNLPLLEPGKPINPFSKQYMVTPLHEASQSSLSTDVIPENTNPKWFDEQIFCVRDRRRPMRFQLWDSHRIFSDKLLGHIQFDMRPLSDYLLYDIWLPLIGPNEGETDPNKRSEIHIMAQFSPMKIHKIINVRLPPFRLQMQKSQYYPGEIVRGFLILNVGKPLSADQVLVRLSGFEETHWTESHTEHYTDSQGRSQTRTVTKHYGQTWPLLNDKRLCWHRSLNPTQEPLLMSGSYVWPFEFMLPPRLPPSFRSTNGWVEYSISAEVDRPGVFTFNKRTQAKLQILAPYTSLQPLPSVYGRLQKLPFRSANEVVYIEGHLDRPVCIIGDQHTLTLKIDNHSNHRVTDCEITLRGQAVYKAHGRVHMVNTEPFFTRIKEPSFPVMPGEAKNVVVVFQIPANTPPSLPADLSPLIDLRYHIHVSCNMSGFLTGRARSDIPIIISHPLPPPVWQIPPPKMYPTEQPELNVRFPPNLHACLQSRNLIQSNTRLSSFRSSWSMVSVCPTLLRPTSLRSHPRVSLFRRILTIKSVRRCSWLHHHRSLPFSTTSHHQTILSEANTLPLLLHLRSSPTRLLSPISGSVCPWTMVAPLPPRLALACPARNPVP
jgi:hypothetical protein